MRVIAGSARRLLLKTVEGMDTRPTTDRIKETLFNMIQNDLYGRSFLDLFAGSGASEAVFIDNGIRQVSCIRDNLKTTKLESGAKVLNCGVLEGLSRLGRDHGAFDFIFMDPPYGCDLERQVLEALQDSPLADGDTVLIAEASLDTDFSWAESLGYEISRTKEYKTNKHVFFKKREN